MLGRGCECKGWAKAGQAHTGVLACTHDISSEQQLQVLLRSKFSGLAAGHGCPQRPQSSLMSSCCTFQVSGRHLGANSC